MVSAKQIGALAFAGVAAAQQSAYGQCGGQGWTGATGCVSGWTCVAQNSYYSQCLPGTAAPTTTLKTTVKPTTTAAPKPPATSSTTAVVKPSTTAVAKPTTTAAAPSSPSSTAFAKAAGSLFNIDGTSKYFAGTNSYWIGFLTNNADVDLVMSHLQTSGLKILRVWGFNDVNTVPDANTVYYQYLSASGSTINTGANGLQRLDYVVKSAEAHGIKLIINFVNNWNDYGGMNAYVQAFGGTQLTWYTNTAAQAQYQKYIAAVIARYKTSSAIFAWELANEPRCTGCDTTVLYNWVKTTAAYIKSLDSAHMTCIGDEGFNPSAGDGSYPYQIGAGGYDWAQTLSIPDIDFGTYHLYPESWSVSTGQWALDWITAHGAVCAAANKPCMLEEFGASKNVSVLAGYENQALNSKGNSADLFWQDGDTLSTGMTSDDGNTIFYGTSQWTTLVTQHIAAINAKK